MEKYIFTDLACEMSYGKTEEKDRLSDRIQKIIYYDPKGPEKNISEGTGHITFFTPKLWTLDDDEFLILKDGIVSELKKYIALHLKNYMEGGNLYVLVVGLGNPYLTPDALGAETVKRIAVTNHSPYFVGSRIRVSAIIPDVMGNTGINTVMAIKAYVKELRPDLVIAVDSLRARSYERLASTVQISDTGMAPGSGITKVKHSLCQATLGVPVISIGIPTVVNSSTMIFEIMTKCDIEIENIELRSMLENNLNFFVALKETDILIKSAAILLSTAINNVLLS